jgi:hypothetical protein
MKGSGKTARGGGKENCISWKTDRLLPSRQLLVRSVAPNRKISENYFVLLNESSVAFNIQLYVLRDIL